MNRLPIARSFCTLIPVETSVDICHIWLSVGHDFKGRFGQDRLDHGIREVSRIECHAGRGLVGDRYYDHKPDFKGQLTLIDTAVLEALANALHLPPVDGSLLRRNIQVTGINLNTLIGKRFRLDDIELSGSEECAPCAWMDQAVAPGAHTWLKGRGGLRCRILNNGTLAQGPAVLEILSEVSA